MLIKSSEDLNADDGFGEPVDLKIKSGQKPDSDAKNILNSEGF